MTSVEPPFVVLITGTRGIGQSIGVEAARRGAAVAMVYCSNEAEAQKTLDAVNEESKKVGNTNTHRIFQADLSENNQCKRVFEEVLAAYGRVDALVNNSGIAVDHEFTLDFEQYTSIVSKTMKTNYESASTMSYLAVRQFLQQSIHPLNTKNIPKPETMKPKRGVLVHITSRAANRGELTCQAYAASKAAMNIMSQSIAKRYAPDSIVSFAVAPGWVNTSMAEAALKADYKGVMAQHPLGRIAEPEEVANCACYCIFDAPLALTGTILDVNGASYAS